MSETEADFFVLAHEPGHDQEALPLWASAREGLIHFDEAPAPVERIDLPDLPPGSYVLMIDTPKTVFRKRLMLLR